MRLELANELLTHNVDKVVSELCSNLGRAFPDFSQSVRPILRIDSWLRRALAHKVKVGDSLSQQICIGIVCNTYSARNHEPATQNQWPVCVWQLNPLLFTLASGRYRPSIELAAGRYIQAYVKLTDFTLLISDEHRMLKDIDFTADGKIKIRAARYKQIAGSTTLYVGRSVQPQP